MPDYWQCTYMKTICVLLNFCGNESRSKLKMSVKTCHEYGMWGRLCGKAISAKFSDWSTVMSGQKMKQILWRQLKVCCQIFIENNHLMKFDSVLYNEINDIFHISLQKLFVIDQLNSSVVPTHPYPYQSFRNI